MKKILIVEGNLKEENLNFSKIVNKYKIDFFVHGDDWKDGVQSEHRKNLIKTMKSWGGKVIDVAYTHGISSSNLISLYKNLLL